MASNSVVSLQAAISAVERSLARLDSVADISVHERNQSAANREAAQSEINASWQQHHAQLETTLAAAHAEAEHLREDNLRLSNQLANLQQEYLTLQNIAGQTVGRLDATVKQLDLILEH